MKRQELALIVPFYIQKMDKQLECSVSTCGRELITAFH